MWRRSKSPRGRDGQLNKQAALEQFHRFFGFDSSEKVLHVCACGLKSSKNSGGFFSGSKSTIEGILYGSTNHLSFIDPRNKKLQTKLPLENVTAIRPGMDSTSLQVETSERKHYFVDFKDRNESMGRFMEIWTQHQSRAASSAFDDPLSIGANVQVMGQNVKVTGRDAMAAAAFAKRHSDKVKVGLNADGSVNVKINPRGRAASSKKKQAAAPRNDDWQVVSGAPRRYVRMRGHTGLQKNRMGIYVEKPELGSGGYSAYKHITGDWYLYYFKSNKFWFVGSRIGKRSGWLYVQSEEQYPDNISKPWRFWDDAEKKWLMDSSISCVHATEADSRNDGVPEGNPATKSDKPETSQRSRGRSAQQKVVNSSESIFEGSKIKNTWFAALFDLYTLCENYDKAFVYRPDEEKAA